MRNDEFRQWILENADNPELDVVMRKILDASASDNYSLAKEGFEEFKNKTGIKPNEFWKKFRYYSIRVTACLFFPVCLLCAWAIYNSPVPEQDWMTITTGVAQTESVILADGTKVTLSPCSQLFYPDRFIGDKRKVMLVGEAFLDVASDKERQFVVSAGEMDVIVHGTKFSVSSFPSEIEDEVALVEGSVEMQFKDRVGSIFLSPGEMVKYDRLTCTTERRKFAVNYFDEVVDAGGLQFLNEKLEDIVASLNRHFNVNIVIGSSSLKEERFFASFINGEDAEEILNALNSDGLFRISRQEKFIYLTK